MFSFLQPLLFIEQVITHQVVEEGEKRVSVGGFSVKLLELSVSPLLLELYSGFDGRVAHELLKLLVALPIHFLLLGLRIVFGCNRNRGSIRGTRVSLLVVFERGPAAREFGAERKRETVGV